MPDAPAREMVPRRQFHNTTSMGNNHVTAVLFGGISLLRCFVGTGIPVFVASPDPKDSAFSSRYCRRKTVIPSPVSKPDEAVQHLVELGKTFSQRPVLIYGDDPTLLFVSRNRERLAEYYRFLLPPSDLVEELVDKTRFACLADRLGLPVPKTVSSHQITTPEQVMEHLSLPCVLKPDSRVGWFESPIVREEGGKPQKVVRANDLQQLARLYGTMKQSTKAFIIQEYIPGGDNCIYSFHAYCDRHSQVLAYYVGRKIRTYPMDSGMSTYLELTEEPELVRIAMEILKKLQFVGVVKVDFKKDAQRNRFYLLEINARFNLWNHLGAVCGVNLPQLAYADLTGQSWTPRSRYKTGVRWLSFANDLRAVLRDYHPDGTLSWVEWLLSYRGRKVYDIFSWRDPYPSVANLMNYSKALLAKVGRRLFK